MFSWFKGDNDWRVLKEKAIPFSKGSDQEWLKENNAPPWRSVGSMESISMPDSVQMSSEDEARGAQYVLPPSKSKVASEDKIESSSETTLELINIALLLKRPLLVQGPAGVGKSSLAYYLAHMLGLGSPLIWPINSQSTLQDGLYFYDAINHLRQSQMTNRQALEMGDFIHLRALGTALLPWDRPRVVLIDEIDKSNYDFPNDLLYVLEEGKFDIPELRQLDTASAFVHTADKGSEKQAVTQGTVSRKHPPIIVMTSNNERQFPEAFLRRCVVLDLETPNKDMMIKILESYFKNSKLTKEKIEEAYAPIAHENAPTDEVLQSMFVALSKGLSVKDIWDQIKR